MGGAGGATFRAGFDSLSSGCRMAVLTIFFPLCPSGRKRRGGGKPFFSASGQTECDPSLCWHAGLFAKPRGSKLVLCGCFAPAQEFVRCLVANRGARAKLEQTRRMANAQCKRRGEC